MTTQTQSWAVIGGGILGMTLALRLANAGKRVTIFEANGQLGGLADAWSLETPSGPITWDRHYHVTLLSDSNLGALLRELDLEQSLIWGTTRTEFFTGTAFHPLNNAIDYLKFPPLRLIDKVRLAATIIYGSRIEDGRHLEDQSAEDWLTQLSGERTWQALWQPLMRAKLGENASLASAAFIWAIIRRLYAARRSGLKTEQFGYIDGGYDKVIARFSEVLRAKGVVIETNAPISTIHRSAHAITLRTPKGDRIFDRCVSSTPTSVAARMAVDLSPAEKSKLSGIVYQGIVCASVVLKSSLNGCYLTYISDATSPFTAVIEMSALVNRVAFNDKTLVYLPRYLASNDEMFNWSDDEVRQFMMPAFMRMYPHVTESDILAFRVSRVRDVLPISTIGYTKKLPPMTTSIPELFLVNSAHILNGTLNVDESVKLANTAMTVLLGVEHTVRSQPSDGSAVSPATVGSGARAA
jgi:protoporphyrinogen oxidase